jgi:2-alkyl-3-oxoalkanoate reductase
MKVLVTGASGFIGSRLCAALAARGYSVRAMYRRETAPPELAALASPAGGAAAAGGPGPGRVELFRADLADEARALEAVLGMDAVIHAAALASDWGPLELFIRQNYDATVRLLEAARDAGARKFVYVSSAQVHGYGAHVDTTERGPYYPLKYPYQITKAMAEEYVLAQNSPSFATVAIRPCNVYGPGDHTSTYPMLDAVLAGYFGYLGPGEALTCPVYIDDLCEGTIAALERDEAAGEAILLTDGMRVRWKDYAGAFYRAVGSRKGPRSLPRPLAYAAAAAMTATARAARSRKRPLLTMYVVEQGSRDFHFSNEKARGLLGFEPKVFYEEGIALTANAYIREKAAAKEERA